MKELTEEQQNIVKLYLDFVTKHKRIPTVSDLVDLDVTRHKIRHHFGNITRLHSLINEDFKDELDKHFTTDAYLFTQEKFDNLKEEVKKYKRFFITTVVTDKQLHKKFFDTIKYYCEVNDALPLFLPCMDVANRSTGFEWILPPELNNELVVFDNLRLNENLFIASIKLSAKQINPLTGLSRIGQRNGSFIYGAPKQMLEFVATSQTSKTPSALMTPGAVTENNYERDEYMSGRSSYIASVDHVFGGIIVEIENERYFHFRQVQASNDGKFIDLGIEYSPERTQKTIETDIVLGDWHAGKTDKTVMEVTSDIIEELSIRDCFVHDFFDGYSISHYDLEKPFNLAKKANEQKDSLEDEIRIGCKDFNFLLNRIGRNIIVVKSNHDERIEKYIRNGHYVNDPKNHHFCLKIALKMFENEDPVKWAYLEQGMINDTDSIIWLDRRDEFKIGRVEMAAHGDIGANGSRGSMITAEKAYGQCVIGHAHSAGILRGVFRVGTSSDLELDYNYGPSSWTQTHCLIYPNGSRQLINIINGKWKL